MNDRKEKLTVVQAVLLISAGMVAVLGSPFVSWKPVSSFIHEHSSWFFALILGCVVTAFILGLYKAGKQVHSYANIQREIQNDLSAKCNLLEKEVFALNYEVANVKHQLPEKISGFKCKCIVLLSRISLTVTRGLQRFSKSEKKLYKIASKTSLAESDDLSQLLKTFFEENHD